MPGQRYQLGFVLPVPLRRLGVYSISPHAMLEIALPATVYFVMFIHLSKRASCSKASILLTDTAWFTRLHG